VLKNNALYATLTFYCSKINRFHPKNLRLTNDLRLNVEHLQLCS